MNVYSAFPLRGYGIRMVATKVKAPPFEIARQDWCQSYFIYRWFYALLKEIRNKGFIGL